MDVRDYEQTGSGFGIAPASDVLELKKALEAGYAGAPEGATDVMTGGAALRVQSLEASLKVLTWKEEHLVLWRDIPKTPAYSTVEEYTQLKEYGPEYGGAFTLEGELPAERTSDYIRKAAFVKFLGDTRVVTHPMTVVRTQVGDVVARENINGILWLLKQLDWALVWGNSKLNVGGTEYVEFDGLLNMIDTANVIDMKGQPLSEKAIQDAAQMVLDNYGVPNALYGSPKVLQDFAKQYLPVERVFVPVPGGGFTGGFIINNYQTVAGMISLKGDLFMRKVSPNTSATHTEAPDAPASVTAVAGTGTDAEWGKTYPNGVTVKYKVTSCNRKGASAPVESNSYTVAAGALTTPVKVTITLGASLTRSPDYYQVYRSDNGGPYTLIARIPCATGQNGPNGATDFIDKNIVVANTYMAFLGEMTPDVIEFRQLLPLIKMDLAIISPAIRWMLLLYGVPVIYAPKKWVKIINIGDAT